MDKSEYEININPLSINTAWAGRRFKTPKYKKWAEDMLWLLKQLKPQEKPYKIEIDLYIAMLMDIDNPIKPILDALTKSGVIEDDRYIEKLIIRKIVSKEKKIVIRFT